MEMLAALIAQQDGVVARWQAVAAGMSEVEIARRIRRGEWCALHPGVYVLHNGPPTWRQRAASAGSAATAARAST